MALKKSEKNLLMLLGVVAVVAGVYEFVIAPGSEEGAAPPPTPIRQIANLTRSAPAAKPVAALPEDAQHYDAWGTDPFALGAPKPSAQSGSGSGGGAKKVKAPELKGIFWKGSKAYALIDDAILAEGESEKTLRVSAISGNEVTCYKNQKQFRLHWRQSP